MAQTVKQFTQSDSHLLTIKEAADFLRISRRSLFYLISKGRLQAVRLSPRMTRISLHELQQLTESAFVASASSFPPFASSTKGLCHCRQADAGRQPRYHYLLPVADVSSRLRGGKPSYCGSPPVTAYCRHIRNTRCCLPPQLFLSYPSSYFLLSSSANRIISTPLSSTAVTAWLNASPSGRASPRSNP